VRPHASPRAARAAVPLLLTAATALARPPEVVRWQDAADHVGRVVTVEGTVASARVAAGACTLEFAPDDPAALRVVLMLGLFSAPVAPERQYEGHRIRASGRVQTFQGRPEMIVRRADQIQVIDDSPSTTTTSPTTTLPPSTAPPPPPPAATSAPTTAPPTPPTTAPEGASSGGPARNERCARARERVEAARRELAARTGDAARCLETATARCQRERDALALALEALPAREAEAGSACE
jgi:hypothetical protein